MTAVFHIIHTGVEALLTPFDLLPPWLGLTLLAMLCGAGMLWVVGKVTPQGRLERMRDRMTSSLYELRIFLDSPRRLLAAQGRLLVTSVRYLGCMLPAFLILFIPITLLFLHLEPRYGLAPLPLHQPILVRVSVDSARAGRALTASGESGIEVTAPPLFVRSEGRVYLRVQIDAPGDHVLDIHEGHTLVKKRLEGGAAAMPVTPERARGAALALAMGDEAPIPPGTGIHAITVDFPDRSGRWLGISMPWWLYWLAVAMASALALRRPMGVTL